ncbi:histidine kinase [Schleiferiaceae bacterium]|nr:histidine kinase [Schleiferiaceae bacterium]
MKIKNVNLVPIILALLLPALRFYSSNEIISSIDYSFVVAWFYSSLVLYSLWYFLWLLWDIKQGNKKWYVLILFGITTTLIILNNKLFDVGSDREFIRLIIPFMFFLTIQYALKSQRKVSKLLLEKEQLQTENYKSQLKTLRTQVDPHFLFNSLNTLRSMIRQQHSGSEHFVLSLSDFYRQTLKHNENTTIPLSEELKVLQSYLYLMKSRNEKAVQIKLDINESLLDHRVPSMALQTVVENCFKHNSMTSKHPLQINISSSEGNYISVCNNTQAKIGDNDTSGMGLNLLRKRYELINIEDGLIVNHTPEQFCILLKLL